MTPELAAQRYIEFYEILTPAGLDYLVELCAPDIQFRDPFNDTVGVTAYHSVLQKMFKDVIEPRFSVQDRACSGSVCYLRWSFSFRMSRKGALWSIEGMSEIHFDAEGRVTKHLDHWDSGAQFYARLPLVGWLVRWVRRRVAAGHKGSTPPPIP